MKTPNAEATKSEIKIFDLVTEVPTSGVLKPYIDDIVSDDLIEQCCQLLQNIYESTAYEAVVKHTEHIRRYDIFTEYAAAAKATQIASKALEQTESGILTRYLQNYEYYEKLFRMYYDVMEDGRTIGLLDEHSLIFESNDSSVETDDFGCEFSDTSNNPVNEECSMLRIRDELNCNEPEISQDINNLFITISNRGASFHDMSTDEKIAEILNLIENLMKGNNGYIKLDFSEICYDFISNDSVKKYRDKLQCFRHASKKSMTERATFTLEQKKFLIKFGLTIVDVVYTLTAS